MSTIQIEGGHALEGTVKPSGSKDSAVKLIIYSLFSNEDIVLENVPHTSDIDLLIEVIKSIGGTVDWIGDNKLSINGNSISTHEIPYELGSSSKYATLLAGPLLFRFGKALIPKGLNTGTRPQPINRWIDTWETFGINVQLEKETIYLEVGELHGSNINFKISTHTGTANALMTAAFILEETNIINAAEETEVDDLIDFINLLGGDAERVEPRKIRITGKNVFSGGYYEVQPDNIEAIAYATAALTTKGNICIQGLKKLQLTSFINFLTKVGARFEYSRESLDVWYGGEEFEAVTVESAPAPGFLADWLPYATLLLTQVPGTSILHNTIYVDRFGFSQDLNRMGADIRLKKPSDVGLQCVISDESYDYGQHGEPQTIAEVVGVTKLRGTRLNMEDSRFNTMLIVAALSAESRSEIIGIDEMFIRYERFLEKLSSLGAVINHLHQ